MFGRPLSVLAAACLPVAASAQALRVPSQHATIGAALAVAQSGQTILVAAGTYAERLTWPSVDGIRLIGESGAANTIIDGTQGGTVVTFASGLTRATLLQGFTIRGGFLAGAHNLGAGIRIDDFSSPTIRANRITGNTIDSINHYATQPANQGGGIYVGSNSDPLIAHNEIDDNELWNGWSSGAGIYIKVLSHAEVVGNHIHDNRNASTATTPGVKAGAGIYCRGAALIASNLITANINGGGIFVDNHDPTIVNNTITAHTVTTTNPNELGGGVYFSGINTGTSVLGNIIANNAGHGIYLGNGAFPVIADYNDVWNNTPANYLNVTPGNHSISVDPMFVSATDHHLIMASPCIDRMPHTLLPATLGKDLDSDSRQIDIGTNGGDTIDFGADEFSEAQLDIVGTAQIGTSHGWLVTTAQPLTAIFALSFSEYNNVFQPIGNMLLGQPVVVSVFGAPAGYSFAVPNDTGLRGVTIFGQALVLAPTGFAGQFTNLASITVF